MLAPVPDAFAKNVVKLDLSIANANENDTSGLDKVLVPSVAVNVTVKVPALAGLVEGVIVNVAPL